MIEVLSEIFSSLNLTKKILAIISISFCLLLIIIYFISCLQIKCSFLAKKETNHSEDARNSFLEKTSVHSIKKKNKKKKIGLGSHYIFFLIFSNLLSEVVEIGAILYYKDKEVDDKHDKSCQIFGFAHNFFDLSSVCWTSMLTLLFYNSTKVTSKMFLKDKKYLIIGIAYNLISCGIFCVIPYFMGCFGFARTYCTFYQPEGGEDFAFIVKVSIWKYIFVVFTLINTIYNIFCFQKTTKFYSTKLALLKKQNHKEYILVLIFVRVFQLFCITLIVSRLLKLVCIVMLEFTGNELNTIEEVVVFSNAIIFNLNGTFNSIASIIFFRGVFWCCISTESDVRDVEQTQEKEDEDKGDIEYKNDEDSINGK